MNVRDKKFENLVIITLLLIVACLLFPIVFKIIEASQLGTAKSSVYGSIDSVKNLYLNEVTSPDSTITLPFTIKYDNGSYKAYCGSKEIDLNYELDTTGRQPISGQIMWGADDKISVINLKYKDYTCNKEPMGDVECQKNSK